MKARLASQTIDIPDGEDDIEQLFHASSEQVKLVDPPLNAETGDFDATPRESVASQSSQQIGEVASPLLQAPKTATPSPVSKQKRTRGFGKSKSPAPIQSDDQMSPGFASKSFQARPKVFPLQVVKPKNKRSKNGATSFFRLAKPG